MQVYNVEDNKFLISLKKGWDGHQAKDFLLQQPEVAKVTWDNHEYRPKPERRRKKKKRRKNAAGEAGANARRTSEL